MLFSKLVKPVKSFFKKLNLHIFLISAVLLLTFLVNLNLFQVPFLYDDFDFLFTWPDIHNFKHIPSLLLGETPIGHEGVYRPARSIFYLLSYHLGDHNLFFYHIQELAIYALCIVFVYFITQKMFERRPLSFFTALIYALLPIHIDNIANLTANFDTIGAVFFFASFYLWQNYIDGKKIHKNALLAASLVLSFFAYATYEITLILPLVIFLYAFFKGKRVQRGVFFLYLAVLSGYLFIRLGLVNTTTRGPVMDNIAMKLMALGSNFTGYIWRTVLPVKLSVPSVYNLKSELLFSKAVEITGGGQNWIVEQIVSYVLFLGICGLGIAGYIKRKMVGLGIVWLLICLLPAMAVSLQSGLLGQTQTLWGKYAILASYGIALILANFLLLLLRLRCKNPVLQYFKIFGIAAIGSLIFWYALVSATNLNFYRDSRPALLKQIQKEPESEEKHNDLGVIYAMYYRYADSERELMKALEINLKYARARENLQKLCLIIEKGRKIEIKALRSCEKIKAKTLRQGN